MPEPTVTPTPYPTLNAWIPYPTPTPFVSVLPTPSYGGTSSVAISRGYAATSIWLMVVLILGIAIFALSRYNRRGQM